MNTCIKCKKEKPWESFYKHPQMASGYLNICKECHKLRMAKRSRISPLVQQYDIKRSKLPHRVRLRRETGRNWRNKNPISYKAHCKVNNAIRDGRLAKEPCLFCGREDVHAHHRDYSKPLDVIWLCPKCHARLHANFPETEGENKSSSTVGTGSK